jgi:hypothetical protein
VLALASIIMYSVMSAIYIAVLFVDDVGFERIRMVEMGYSIFLNFAIAITFVLFAVYMYAALRRLVSEEEAEAEMTDDIQTIMYKVSIVTVLCTIVLFGRGIYLTVFATLSSFGISKIEMHWVNFSSLWISCVLELVQMVLILFVFQNTIEEPAEEYIDDE